MKNDDSLLGRVTEIPENFFDKKLQWTVETANSRYSFKRISLLDPGFRPEIGEIIQFQPLSIDENTEIAVQVKEVNEETAQKFDKKYEKCVLKESTKGNRQSLSSQIIYRPAEVCFLSKNWLKNAKINLKKKKIFEKIYIL